MRRQTQLWTVVIVTTIALVLFFALGSYAREYESRHGHFHERFMFDPLHKVERYAKDLELTKEQQDKIGRLRLDYEKRRIELRSKLSIARVELNYLIHNSPENEKEISARIEEVGKTTADLSRLAVEIGSKLREILTKEQQDKFRELLLGESSHKSKY